ncbi:MAG: hypothetical protein V7K27_26270 [Nostoc sp.]|uniref:hypothetical protein n=1 Tax=Nostoc sp. TaxID=1180 RepID=UPI002FF4E5F4
MSNAVPLRQMWFKYMISAVNQELQVGERMSNFRDRTESNTDKVLLIGVTGGTGGNVVKGFLEQGVTNLRVITREIDLNRPILAKLNSH